MQMQGAAVEAFLARLDACAAGDTAFTLVLDDPAGNSYVEAGAGADTALTLERYERTPEQARGMALGCMQGTHVSGALRNPGMASLRCCTTWLTMLSAKYKPPQHLQRHDDVLHVQRQASSIISGTTCVGASVCASSIPRLACDRLRR